MYFMFGEQGGTSAAPTHLNDRNRQEAANFWPDATRCDYFVGLQQEGETSLQGKLAWVLSFWVHKGLCTLCSAVATIPSA